MYMYVFLVLFAEGLHANEVSASRKSPRRMYSASIGVREIQSLEASRDTKLNTEERSHNWKMGETAAFSL